MGDTVLVTGATGFIGKITVEALTNSGWHVIVGIRNQETEMNFENIKLDLNDPENILALEDKLDVDAIVHLGAQVGLTEESDSYLFVPNVLSTGCIAHLAKSWGAELLFTSSIMTHGIKAEKIFLESPLYPDTPYARSKYLAEQLIQSSGASYCILRIAGVFGANGPSHLGLNKSITGALNGIVPTQIGSGKASRNYVYVKDVARIISYVLEKKLTGIHLLAGSEILQISQMLQIICDTFLPGNQPLNIEGPEARDQIVMPSKKLPKTRSFREALLDIKKEMNP